MAFLNILLVDSSAVMSSKPIVALPDDFRYKAWLAERAAQALAQRAQTFCQAFDSVPLGQKTVDIFSVARPFRRREGGGHYVKKGRYPKRYSQTARVEILRLRLATPVTVKDLAQEFDVSEKQVRRDLQAMEEAGYPLMNEDGAWFLEPGFKGLKIAVSPYELLSLHFAKRHLDYLKGTPFYEDLDSITQKVEAGLPDRIRNHLNRIVTAFSPLQRPIRDYASQKDILIRMRAALLRQLTVTIMYQKAGARQPSVYTIDPYVMILYDHGLYLHGYSHAAKENRMFAVERIRAVEISSESFDMPELSSAPDIERPAFGLIEESPQKVEIRFSRAIAYLIKERRWHPTQVVTCLKDGSVLMRMQCGGLDELTSWVLSFGADAKVLAPPEFVTSVCKKLTAARTQYR